MWSGATEPPVNPPLTARAQTVNEHLPPGFGMDGLIALDLGRDALWTTVAMAAPAMLAGLLVGVVIALLQALTQVQEMTLVFVPKIVTIFIALVLFLPMMGALLGQFTTEIFTRIAGM